MAGSLIYRFCAEPLDQRAVRLHNCGLIWLIKYQSWLIGGMFAYVADLGIVDRDFARFTRLGMPRCDNRGLFKRTVGHFPAFSDDHDMRPGDLLGVEPDVPIAAVFEGQPVVLKIVSATEDRKAVIRNELKRRETFLLHATPHSAAYITFPRKLRPDRGKLTLKRRTGQFVKNGVKIRKFRLTLCNERTQLLFSGIRLAVLRIVPLGVLGGREAHVPAGSQSPGSLPHSSSGRGRYSALFPTHRGLN